MVGICRILSYGKHYSTRRFDQLSTVISATRRIEHVVGTSRIFSYEDTVIIEQGDMTSFQLVSQLLGGLIASWKAPSPPPC